MPRKSQKRFKLSEPSLVGTEMPYYDDVWDGETRVKIVMEIVSPNGHCFIYEDRGNKDKYAGAGKAIREFMKGAKKDG